MLFQVNKAGRLSKSQIVKGYEILKKLEASIVKPDELRKRNLEEFSSQFYTLIPHSFGMKRPPIIDSLILLKKKMALLEVFSTSYFCLVFFFCIIITIVCSTLFNSCVNIVRLYLTWKLLENFLNKHQVASWRKMLLTCTIEIFMPNLYLLQRIAKPYK